MEGQGALFPWDTRKGTEPKAPLPFSCLGDQTTAESGLPLQVPCMLSPRLK